MCGMLGSMALNEKCSGKLTYNPLSQLIDAQGYLQKIASFKKIYSSHLHDLL